MNEFIDFMRDWGWPILFVLVSVLIGVPTVYLMLKQQARKRFEYEILFRSSIVDVSPGFKSSVRVLFEDQPVERLEVVGIDFTNSGNTPIVETDFVRPVKVSFGPGARVLSLKAVGEPEDCVPFISGDVNSFQLSRMMVNPGDIIRTTTLVSGAEYIRVEGRIVGVKQIQASSGRRQSGNTFKLLLRFSAPMLGAAMIAIFFPAAFDSSDQWMPAYMFGVAVTLILFFLIDLLPIGPKEKRSIKSEDN